VRRCNFPREAVPAEARRTARPVYKSRWRRRGTPRILRATQYGGPSAPHSKSDPDRPIWRISFAPQANSSTAASGASNRRQPELNARSTRHRLAQNQQSMNAARIFSLLQEFVERLRSIAIAMLVRDVDLPACIFQAASFRNRRLRSQPQCLHQVSVFGSVDREGHCRLLAPARLGDHKLRARARKSVAAVPHMTMAYLTSANDRSPMNRPSE